jgi:hypothetical protein
MGGARSAQRETRNAYKIMETVQKAGGGGRIILKWILRK